MEKVSASQRSVGEHLEVAAGHELREEVALPEEGAPDVAAREAGNDIWVILKRNMESLMLVNTGASTEGSRGGEGLA